MHLFSFLKRTLLTILLTLVLLISMKKNANLKDLIYQEVYTKHFPFLQVGSWYQKTFGTTFPFGKYLETKTVFHEKLVYEEKEDYLDGVKLKVENTYPVPILQDGLVIFVGEKEGYGKVVIIEQLDGVDCWYGNLTNVNVKLYDYVETGNLLGMSENYLYLVYKKEGEAISYEDYLL